MSKIQGHTAKSCAGPWLLSREEQAWRWTICWWNHLVTLSHPLVCHLLPRFSLFSSGDCLTFTGLLPRLVYYCFPQSHTWVSTSHCFLTCSSAHLLSHGNILQDEEASWCHVGPGDSSRSCSGLSHCLMFCCCLQFVCCCFIEFLNYGLRHLPVQDALNKLYLYYMLPVL